MKVSNFIPENVGFFVKIYKQRITQKKKLEPAHPKKEAGAGTSPPKKEAGAGTSPPK